MTCTAAGALGVGVSLPQHRVEVAGAVKCRGGFQQSSRAYKDVQGPFSAAEAKETLQQLLPVQFRYKTDEQRETHIGFFVEDVPAIAATADGACVNVSNVVAVLSKCAQEQQHTIAQQAQQLQAEDACIQQLTMQLQQQQL